MSSFNQASMYAASVVLPCLASVAVALRFRVRRMKASGYDWDDWSILIALVLTWFLGIIVIVGTALEALGTHTAINPITGANILTIREINDSRVIFVFLLVMILNFGVIKISVLLMYRRIFMGRAFNIISLTMCVIIGAWATAFFFATAFQCGTHAAAWWTSAKAIKQYCVRYQALQLGHAVSDVVTDVMVLALPVPAVWRLQMSTIQKVTVIAIFALGLFSTAAACVRLYFVYTDQYRTTTGYRDLIGISSVIILWSVVEAGVAVFAACLPTLRPLFRGHSPESLLQGVRSMLSLTSLSRRERSSLDAKEGASPSEHSVNTATHTVSPVVGRGEQSNVFGDDTTLAVVEKRDPSHSHERSRLSSSATRTEMGSRAGSTNHEKDMV